MHICVTFADMKRLFLLCVILTLLCGCSKMQKHQIPLEHGMAKEDVISIWGKPSSRAPVGTTREGYPVEVWEYNKKTLKWLKKSEYIIIIFVDEELYGWKANDPKFAFSELTDLGVLKVDYSDYSLREYQRQLRDAAEQAQQTQRTMETIRNYQNYKNTQMHMRTQQQMHLFQKPPNIISPKFAPKTNRP